MTKTLLFDLKSSRPAVETRASALFGLKSRSQLFDYVLR